MIMYLDEGIKRFSTYCNDMRMDYQGMYLYNQYAYFSAYIVYIRQNKKPVKSLSRKLKIIHPTEILKHILNVFDEC